MKLPRPVHPAVHIPLWVAPLREVDLPVNRIMLKAWARPTTDATKGECWVDVQVIQSDGSIRYAYQPLANSHEVFDYLKVIAGAMSHSPDVTDLTLQYAAEIALDPTNVLNQNWRKTWNLRRFNADF